MKPRYYNTDTKINMELSEWYTIPISYNTDLLTRLGLVLPILSGKKLVVDLEYNGKIQFQRTMRDTGNNVTFPAYNPIFDELNQRVYGPIHRFEIDYPPTLDMLMVNTLSLKETIKHTPIKIKKKYCHPPTEGSKKIAKVIARSSLEKTLVTLHNFITCNIDDRKYEVRTENMDSLVKKYMNTGKIVGDCKQISTFTAGIANALGLCARRIEGSVSYSEDYKSKKEHLEKLLHNAYKRLERLEDSSYNPNIIIQNHKKHIDYIKRKIKDLTPEKLYATNKGHVWTEIYIPKQNDKGTWILVDPAIGFFGLYPPIRRICYMYMVNLPTFLDSTIKSAKLRIDYYRDEDRIRRFIKLIKKEF